MTVCYENWKIRIQMTFLKRFFLQWRPPTFTSIHNWVYPSFYFLQLTTYASISLQIYAISSISLYYLGRNHTRTPHVTASTTGIYCHYMSIKKVTTKKILKRKTKKEKTYITLFNPKQNIEKGKKFPIWES